MESLQTDLERSQKKNSSPLEKSSLSNPLNRSQSDEFKPNSSDRKFHQELAKQLAESLKNQS
jgi:hypothetical protein